MTQISTLAAGPFHSDFIATSPAGRQRVSIVATWPTCRLTIAGETRSYDVIELLETAPRGGDRVVWDHVKTVLRRMVGSAIDSHYAARKAAGDRRGAALSAAIAKAGGGREIWAALRDYCRAGGEGSRARSAYQTMVEYADVDRVDGESVASEMARRGEVVDRLIRTARSLGYPWE